MLVNLESVLFDLQSLGDPRAIELWRKLGYKVEKYFGVNLTNIKLISKKIKINHELSVQLWESGYHDAKLLATYISDHNKIDELTIDKWSLALNSWDLSDKFCENAVSKTNFAEKKIEEWLTSDNVMQRRCAYILIYNICKIGKKVSNPLKYLTPVKTGLLDIENSVRDGANYAIIGLGSISEEMKTECLNILKETGKPKITLYGSCKPPDAEKLIMNGKKGRFGK